MHLWLCSPPWQHTFTYVLAYMLVHRHRYAGRPNVHIAHHTQLCWQAPARVLIVLRVTQAHTCHTLYHCVLALSYTQLEGCSLTLMYIFSQSQQALACWHHHWYNQMRIPTNTVISLHLQLLQEQNSHFWYPAEVLFSQANLTIKGSGSDFYVNEEQFLWPY